MKDIKEYLQSALGKELKEDEIIAMNPLVLAYVGDTVYDLLVRTYLISTTNMSVHMLHKSAVSFVKAGSQAHALYAIERLLTDKEKSIVRRGRNAKSGTIPKHADVGEYRLATGLEALFGYLYLTQREERIIEIFTYILKQIEEIQRKTKE